jgi:hypothetical protein
MVKTEGYPAFLHDALRYNMVRYFQDTDGSVILVAAGVAALGLHVGDVEVCLHELLAEIREPAKR